MRNKQRGGEGHQGHTVIDSVYHGRPEYGLYTAQQMGQMGAKVGGSRRQEADTYIVEKFERKEKNQRGGFAQEQLNTHLERIQGIIDNMIDVSQSSDKDIINILEREINPQTSARYGKKQAEQILKEYYLFNAKKVGGSKLLNKFIRENQKGGNRVVLPLTFFTGEIPNKITVPSTIGNYCA
jgi:hypothetical protein